MLIRVLVADDQQLQRLAFRMLVERQPGMAVTGEAAHGAEAVRMATALRPDVVLMDARMPGTDGIEATRQIVASGSRARVLIVTGFDLDEYAYAGLRAGASGFLLKDAAPEELIARDLVLAESTVKKHVGRVLEKVRARDRVQAVIFAYETGLAAAGTNTHSSPSRSTSP